MNGLLADIQLQGHLRYLHRLLVRLDLLPILEELNLTFATFADLDLPPDVDDRTLWNSCQRLGWVLFTENRNQDSIDSLEATLADSWRVGHLPVLTLANRDEFVRHREYAEEVAADIGDLLFGIVHGEFCDQSRIYVPR
jgi:hypothetical protein